MADDAPPPTAANDTHPTIIVVFNQKGGIGKTTTAVNLAVCLAAFGRSVMVVDLDSQSNATTSLGLVSPPTRGAYELISGTATLADTKKPTRYPNLFVCAASDELAGADIELALAEEPQRQLARAVRAHPAGVEYVVIDCPPALGMLPVNALVAGDAVIMPVAPEPMARDGLHKAWRHIQRIKANLNPRLAVAGILITMAESDGLHDMLGETIRAEFGDRVLPVQVPRDKAVVSASAHDRPSSVASPDSPAADAYLRLAELMLTREGAAWFPPPSRPSTIGIEGARAVLRDWGQGRNAIPPSTAVVGEPPPPGWSRDAVAATSAADVDAALGAAMGGLKWKLGAAVLLFLLGVIVGIAAGAGWMGMQLPGP